MKCNQNDILVVRDDLLPGGTKQRAIGPYLAYWSNKGQYTFNYASPFSGYAQIALSLAAYELGLSCNIFVEKHNGCISEFSKIAGRCAQIHLCDSLENAEFQATLHEGHKIPLGFNDELYKQYLQRELTAQWQSIEKYQPQRVWVPVGSGTLARVLRAIIPLEVQLLCVDVRVLHRTDPRISNLNELKNSMYFTTWEEFSEPAERLPPINSNKYYDAKLWRIIHKYGKNNDLWWNVAS